MLLISSCTVPRRISPRKCSNISKRNHRISWRINNPYFFPRDRKWFFFQVIKRSLYFGPRPCKLENSFLCLRFFQHSLNTQKQPGAKNSFVRKSNGQKHVLDARLNRTERKKTRSDKSLNDRLNRWCSHPHLGQITEALYLKNEKKHIFDRECRWWWLCSILRKLFPITFLTISGCTESQTSHSFTSCVSLFSFPSTRRIWLS